MPAVNYQLPAALGVIAVKGIHKLVALLTGVALLSGCSGASVENLLTAPKLTQEQGQIYQALINSSGSSIKLKYPRGGDYRSAFVLYDIDNDACEEALVFYESQSVQSGESALRLKVLDKSDDQWQAMYDLACVGSEVESISFASLGGCGTTEIIVCYSTLNQTEKTLSVLNYAGGTLAELYNGTYACMEVIDLNADGLDELVTVIPDKISQVSTAAMFTKTDDGFVKLGDTQLSGSATEYVSVTKGLLDEDTTALFLDYSKGSGQYSTDVVYCADGVITSPMNRKVGADGSSYTLISRFTNDYMTDIQCFDIDGDGLVEIPSMTPLPGYETLQRSEQLCAVEWYAVENNTYKQKYYSYYSSKYNFAMIFPSRWQGIVSAVVNSTDNEIIFISYSAEKGVTVDDSTELLRVRTVDKDDSEALVSSKDFRMVGENDESIVCIKESVGYLTGSLALTETELQNCLIVAKE